MPKRKTPEEKPADQLERFQDTAKTLGVDEKELEKAFAKVARAQKA